MLKPYYQDGWATIYHGDCREILPHVEPVDLVLTDPPYGVGVNYASYADTQEALESIISDCYKPMRKLAPRLALTPGIKNISLWPRPDWVLCWAISGAGSVGPWGFSCWQPIFVYGPDPYLEQGKGCRPDLLYLNEQSERNGHPCPKPLKVWKRLLQRCTLANSVLDPFMGSGTTLRAAKDIGIKSIGIEIEEKYCEIAVKRLRQESLLGLLELNK